MPCTTLAGLMKMFMQEILPANVTKAIFVDTDAFFISDPVHLWNVFSTLRPETAFVIPFHPDVVDHWNGAGRICSCIMLLDMQKLRDKRFMGSSLYKKINPEDTEEALADAAFLAKYGPPSTEGKNKGKHENVMLGDQGLWWAVVDSYKEMVEPLSYDFEVTSCNVESYGTGLGDDNVSEEDELKRQTHTKDTPQEVS